MNQEIKSVIYLLNQLFIVTEHGILYWPNEKKIKNYSLF